MIARACIFKPVRIVIRLGVIGEILYAMLPRAAQFAMNTSFRMFADSGAATGAKSGAKADETYLSAKAIGLLPTQIATFYRDLLQPWLNQCYQRYQLLKS